MDRKKMRDILLVGAILIALFAVSQHLGWFGDLFVKLLGILRPFLVAGCLALFLNVPMRFFENRVFCFLDRSKFGKKAKRPLAVLCVFAILLLIVCLVLPYMVKEIVATIESIVDLLPDAYAKLNEWLLTKDINLGEYITAALVPPTEDQLNQQLEQIFKFALNGVAFSTGVIGTVYQSLLDMFFTIMFTVFFLFSKEKLAKQFKRLGYAYLPADKMDWLIKVCRRSQQTFASFMTGQCLEASILGVMFFLTMTLFGMPYELLISVFIAIMALIPVLGAWIGCIAGAFLILVANPAQALGFIILFLVLQQIEGNLIYPHVMGNAIGLPSIWVLFAVVVGEGLLGIAGMILFIPLTSVVYSLTRDSVNRIEQEKKAVKRAGN
ncbi:MAG: AI-2E family transporter [Clostridiales bacterium]|nr:AI-2E family transporter [Clostridiales bacterium]